MNIINFLVTYGFEFLNLQISVPLDFEKTHFLTFPLWLPTLVSAIGSLLLILWSGIMYNTHNLE